MASPLLASFPIASSIKTSDGCWRGKKSTNKYYYASSYAFRASWHKTRHHTKEYYVTKLSRQNTLKSHHFKSIEMMMGSNGDKCERKYFMKATSSDSHESELQAQHHVSKDIISKFIKDAIDVLLKFSRPYATICLLTSVISASLLAVEKLSDISPAFFIGLFQYAAACYFMLVYNMGLNDLVDVEIDKINKPYLPLASGKYSSKTGVFVTALSLLMSLWLGWITGSKPMLWGFLVSFVLCTAYSANLPLLRWKRFTSLTLVYNIGHMTTMINLVPFLHMKTHVLKRAAIFPRSMIFTLVMTGVYYVIIALAKDLPDIEGDKAGGIQTLAVRIGAERVFWFCVSLLEMAYGAAIVVGATSPFLWTKIVMVLGHAIMALVLWYKAKSVDLKSKAATRSFFMSIFKLLYAEVIVIALAR